MIYTIKKVNEAIHWENIPAMTIDNVLWTADTGVRGQGQLCYDNERLYVHLSAAEKDIRAEYTQPLSPVHEDSCLEFFFQPEGWENYFNIEVNPNGCACIQVGPCRGDRIDIVRRSDASYFDIRTNRTEGGWDVFYHIPLKFIRLFCPGYRFEGTLYANLYKCGDKTIAPHYLSWAPIDLPKPDFHCPAYFGKMIFE